MSWNEGRRKSKTEYIQSNNFLRALSIVPPTQDWDRIQRARHYARDPTFHAWPPNIRLFHPFDGTAFDVANVIEELELKPFEIVLDTWVIIPHAEALQAGWESFSSTPSVIDAVEDTNPYEEEDRKVQELIAREEEKGREKYEARRKSKGGAAKEIEEYAMYRKKSPAELLQEQKESYEAFGGPCILCLEPNLESKQKLCDLREALADVLDHDDYSSPSSSYSWKYVKDMDMGYRPVIPISKFESDQIALDVARRLKGLWGGPLRFDVKELHLISCMDDEGKDQDEWDLLGPQAVSEWHQEPWMRNAKIMLLGEEMEQDENSNEDMIEKLLEEGEPGGMDISNDFTILDDEDETIGNIEDWLDQDDDWDEGTQVVIGRTQFFTGEQRLYTGMPASSVVDSKDRSMGESGGSISGLARRRRTNSRNGNSWAEGEYGRRDSDYLPWTKRDRNSKKGL